MCTHETETAKQNVYFKVTNGLGVVVNLASEISKSIKIRKS